MRNILQYILVRNLMDTGPNSGISGQGGGGARKTKFPTISDKISDNYL